MAPAANIGKPQESTCVAGGFPLLWTAFTLVPMALIEDENPDLWLNFLRERVPHDQSFCSIAFEEQHVVCLYETKRKQDSNAFQNHVIPYLLTRACAIDGNMVLAIREGDKLAIVAFKDEKLQIGNILEASTKEQALFWILKTYEQIQLPLETPIYIQCGEGTRRLLQSHLNTQSLD